MWGFKCKVVPVVVLDSPAGQEWFMYMGISVVFLKGFWQVCLFSAMTRSPNLSRIDTGLVGAACAKISWRNSPFTSSKKVGKHSPTSLFVVKVTSLQTNFYFWVKPLLKTVGNGGPDWGERRCARSTGCHTKRAVMLLIWDNPLHIFWYRNHITALSN